MQIHNNLKENTEQVQVMFCHYGFGKYKEKKSDKYTHSVFFFYLCNLLTGRQRRLTLRNLYAVTEV